MPFYNVDIGCEAKSSISFRAFGPLDALGDRFPGKPANRLEHTAGTSSTDDTLDRTKLLLLLSYKQDEIRLNAPASVPGAKGPERKQCRSCARGPPLP